ncbi:MAG: GTP cyclohydrolase I FolE [Saprospiraceae bacterium]|nr:GTP cyclohydrolase I FolE [Saprospiraceae bacterium]
MILEDRLNGNGNAQSAFHSTDRSDTDFDLGDQHVGTAMDTPMKPDAFAISDEEKMNKISNHFAEIMDILGMDLEDDSLSGTPRRVAKMFVKEIFYGLDPKNRPSISLFENKFRYRQMLVEKDITVKSFCEHHFLPIYGRAHIAYIANGQVVGLSKLNRIVDYYSRRPQVQERLTMQIAEELKQVLNTEDVAVYIDAKHMCVQARGIEHEHCSTVTTEYCGKFLNENIRAEFLQSIR